MPNYRLSIDLVDLSKEISEYSLREYRLPFCMYILEADNPDDACHTIMMRIMKALIKESNTIKTRILCRKVRKHMRLDRVQVI